MLNLLTLWRKSRLKNLIKINKELEKQVNLQACLNELLEEEDEIQKKTLVANSK